MFSSDSGIDEKSVRIDEKSEIWPCCFTLKQANRHPQQVEMTYLIHLLVKSSSKSLWPELYIFSFFPCPHIKIYLKYCFSILISWKTVHRKTISIFSILYALFFLHFLLNLFPHMNQKNTHSNNWIFFCLFSILCCQLKIWILRNFFEQRGKKKCAVQSYK